MVKILDRALANMADMPCGSEIDINNVTLRLALDTTGACQALPDPLIAVRLDGPCQYLTQCRGRQLQ